MYKRSYEYLFVILGEPTPAVKRTNCAFGGIKKKVR